jgi:hypothetical protein
MGFNPKAPIPKEIFAAHPPRRISSESTRKDRETEVKAPSTRESLNLPSKVIKWSLPTDPATPILMSAGYLMKRVLVTF